MYPAIVKSLETPLDLNDSHSTRELGINTEEGERDCYLEITNMLRIYK